MKKSGKIVESCGADLEIQMFLTLVLPLVLSGVPASLRVTNLCHQTLLLSSLSNTIANKLLHAVQSDCYYCSQYKKFYHLKSNF